MLNPLLRGGEARQGERRERFLGGVRQRREEVMFGTRGDQVSRVGRGLGAWRLTCLSQILQLDFLSSQRHWEAERTREAPPLVEEAESEIDVEMEGRVGVEAGQMLPRAPSHSSRAEQEPCARDLILQRGNSSVLHTSDLHHNREPEELDALLQAEAQEFEELVAWQEQQRQGPNQHQVWQQHAAGEYGGRHSTSSPVYGSENDEGFEVALAEVARTATNSGGSEVGGEDMDMT